LEINRHGEWVWITTDGPISPEHARYRIDDGGERRDLPLLEADIEKWDGYSFDLIGLKIDWPSMQAKVESGLWGDGPVVHWGADLTLVVRYMRAQWHRKIEMTNTDSYSYRSSVLFAEYVVSNRGNPRERDGAIRGVALHHDTDDRKHAWLARDLLLKGLRGAPRGPRVGGDVERWVLRARQIGRPQARLEFKAGLGAMYTAADGRWWNVAVDPHIQQKRR